MVLCKAGQIGVSEYLISWLLWSADERLATGLYVFPTDTHVSDFSAARLGPAIDPEVSQYLADLVMPASGGQRGADRVSLKRVGARFIYFRGAKVQPGGRAPQLRSVDADVLILDEYDEMDPRAPALARERLGHSAIGDVRVASTPTFANVGIHREYLASDQRTWHVRCSKCGQWQDLTIHDMVVEWDDLGRPVGWHQDKEGIPFLACRQCGGRMNRDGDGEWVATYPDRAVHGYHISRLFAPYRDLQEILDSLNTVDETERQQAYNQGLGLPYRGAAIMALDREMLDACRREYGLGSGLGADKRIGNRVAGVDVGRVLHVVVRDVMADGDRTARFIGEVPDCEDVAHILDMYGVGRCVIDALPETRKARELQASRPRGQVWLAYYTRQKQGSKKKGPVDLNPRERTVNLDRTRTLDATLALFALAGRGEAGNTLPANARDLADYYDHLTALERRLVDGSDGNKVAVYVESGPDHYGHAENYCNVAAELPVPVEDTSAGLVFPEAHVFGEKEEQEPVDEDEVWVPRMV